MQDSFNVDNEKNIVLSYELLYLLRWLIEHESSALKKLVKKALKSGALKSTNTTIHDYVEIHISDPNIQQSILEFLGFMDSLLMLVEHEEGTYLMNNPSIPALNKIDSTICRQEVLQACLEQASLELQSNPNQNIQELLLKELLKRWKPTKKECAN